MFYRGKLCYIQIKCKWWYWELYSLRWAVPRISIVKQMSWLFLWYCSINNFCETEILCTPVIIDFLLMTWMPQAGFSSPVGDLEMNLWELGAFKNRDAPSRVLRTPWLWRCEQSLALKAEQEEWGIEVLEVHIKKEKTRSGSSANYEAWEGCQHWKDWRVTPLGFLNQMLLLMCFYCGRVFSTHAYGYKQLAFRLCTQYTHSQACFQIWQWSN